MEILSIVKWIVIAITILAVFYFIANYLKYRLPAGRQDETVEGEVFYKFADTMPSHRETFEQMFLGKSSIRLNDRSQWFVSKQDRAKAWPESPHAMREKGYTVQVKLSAKPLRFGGYGPAKIESVVKLDKQPIIGK
jgi:hypothetical protein